MLGKADAEKGYYTGGKEILQGEGLCENRAEGRGRGKCWRKENVGEKVMWGEWGFIS